MNAEKSNTTNDSKKRTRRPIRNLHVTVCEPDIIAIEPDGSRRTRRFAIEP